MSPEEHWDRFAEFCVYELAAGGPDPHLAYTGWLSRGETAEELAWRGGVYVLVYNTASAEVIWQHWPWRKAHADPEGLGRWVTEHWSGLRLHRHRRAAKSPAKLTAALAGLIDWLDFLPSMALNLPRQTPAAYRQIWAEVQTIPTIGRYSGFKLVEYLHRYYGLPTPAHDIRAPGGYSPRTTLTWLWPTLAARIAPKDNRAAALTASDRAAAHTRDRLADITGLTVDWFRLEVFLCEYQQAAHGHQYPGRSTDREMDYLAAVQPYWGDRYTSEIPAARTALHHPDCLGELHGWTGAREPLNPLLAERGYTWSDHRYRWPTDPATPEEKPNGHERARDIAKKALAAG